MSHHFDTAIAREDPRLNLLDFYLFRGQPGTTVMAMTVNPNAGTKAPDTFHEEGLYAFRFDVNDDAHEEVTFKIRFGEAGHAEGEGPEGRHGQTLEVRRGTGKDAAEGTQGEVIASGTTGRILAGDPGVRIFVGLAPDLFAANRTGIDAYRAALAAGKFAPDLFRGAANYFQNRNVTAIVMEVPTQLIGDPAATVRAWVTVSLCGHAPEVQVSRWGLPPKVSTEHIHSHSGYKGDGFNLCFIAKNHSLSVTYGSSKIANALGLSKEETRLKAHRLIDKLAGDTRF